MRSIGIMATAIVGTIAVGAVAIGVRSIPDIKRYLKMRSM